MRTVSAFIATPSTTELTVKTTFSPPAGFQRSPWHSPAPYLFAGVAAMLGLIAFALVILACSYRKRSGDDPEAGAGAGEDDNLKVMPVFEEKIVVIMAGDLNPTFLATPIYMSSKGSSFGNKCEKESEELNDEKLKEQVIAMEVRYQKDEELQHSNGESSH
ncbi:PREDICTED: protein GLUTAMINE DUMPER 2-like [Nicotiana attenuata]|uniref:Protein glutamine dumper 5 n=1 Tax=Nicotiana attenuata TaxID=49451 RepID=A0A314KZQ8_NICAT|nr:PREDICTED: protein GLUTAMINE DUMPER 2-like [Nicotiana attenuata]OIT34269.1 protein glutamine dumper 5 [Nicotiana attenuata]